MRAVADGALDVTHEFAEEMSYCLGCLACQTACPAGVNYAELFETARSDIERQDAQPGVARRFWRALTLRFLFMHPRALRVVGRVAAAVSAQRARGVGAPDRASCGCCRRRCAGSSRRRRASRRAFSNALIAPAGGAVGPRALPGRAADWLRAGSGVPGRQPRHRGRPAGQRLRGRYAAGAAVLRIAARAQRRPGTTRAMLARRMIDLFPPDRYDAIISNAGGCGSHLRRYGPLLA